MVRPRIWFWRDCGKRRLRRAIAALEKIRERLLKANENYWALQVEIQESVVMAWALFAAGKKDTALREMESAAELEDGTEKSAVTPGPLAPARELLGEMFMETSQPGLALAEFETTLKKEPRRFRSLYGAGQAAQMSGHRESSPNVFSRVIEHMCARADKPARSELQEAERAISQK